MITFLYGPPGSGKTYTILETMKQDAEKGIRSFLIVPEQETVALERQALLMLPPSAQLTAEVLNFSRLANRVFREYGGLCYHYIDKGAKAFLMWKTLKELSSLLESFSSESVTDSSLSEWMLAAVSEIKASCVTAASLERAADELPTDDPLRAKLRDLALVYSSYTGLVSESFDDSADDLSRLALLLKKHDFFKGTHVYIDSFTSYTSAELHVIEEIAKGADELTVTFASPSPRSTALHLASVTDTSMRLTRLLGAENVKSVILSENYRTNRKELRLLSDYLWRLDLQRDAVPTIEEAERGGVRLFSATTVYEEAEHIALEILKLVRRGYRYRDIVVAARDATTLTGILDYVFEKYEIPYFLSEKEDLISLPPLKLILSALRIVSGNWQRSDVIAYAKTGLCDVPPADVDLFEEYVTTWSISGKKFTADTAWDMNADGYTGISSARGKAILDAANRVRSAIVPPLLTLSESLRDAKTIRDECDALLTFTRTLSFEDKLLARSSDAQARGNKQLADIYVRLYALITELFEKIALLSPEGSDEPLSAEELENALRILLRSTEIGTIPTAVDEITIGSAHMLRASGVRCAILYGLCEGEFPAAVDDSGMFSSAERHRLQDLGVELSAGYDFRSSDELLYVSRAVSFPSELLILSTHLSGSDGASTRPSLAFLRAQRLLPHVKVETLDSIPPEERIVTKRNSLDIYPLLKDKNAGEALRRIYREDSSLCGVVEAAEIPVSETACKVSTDCAADCFGDRMTLSQTRLEKYVKCPFDYYCTYLLKLREKKEAVFSGSDSGSFLHRVLDRFFSMAISESGALSAYSREEIEQIADEVIAEYREEILPPSMSLEDYGRLPHLYRRLRELSVMMIENILDEFAESDFVPRFFELKIGGSGAPAPLTFILKDGSTLSLPGIIDRVDLCKKNGKLYIRIVDYKTGVKDFSLSDLEVGLNTQMLIYLFTLCHAKPFFKDTLKEGVTEILPAGALYHSSALSPIALDTYPDGDTPTDVRRMAEKKFERSGILTSDEEVLRAMNRELCSDYLPGVKQSKKTGEISGSSLVSPEDFLRLEAEIRETVCHVAEKMRSGKADAAPLEYKGQIPCTYCDMRPICRRNSSSDSESNENS